MYFDGKRRICESVDSWLGHKRFLFLVLWLLKNIQTSTVTYKKGLTMNKGKTAAFAMEISRECVMELRSLQDPTEQMVVQTEPAHEFPFPCGYIDDRPEPNHRRSR
ncbi:MAG: hypothetical protein AAB770_01935 [Patescibacteria group bacterium]